jgi:opacity protein-like surface antigen
MHLQLNRFKQLQVSFRSFSRLNQYPCPRYTEYTHRTWVTEFPTTWRRKVKKFSSLLFVVLAFFSVQSFAASDLYGGISYAMVEYKEDGFPSVNPTAAVFTLGTNLNKNLAVEGRLGTGLSDDDIRVSGVNVTVEVDNFYGVYGRLIMPANDKLSVYGLVGWTKGKLTAKSSFATINADDSDVSYGLGADFGLTDTVSLNAEYARLFSGSDFKVNALTVGARIRF